MQLHNHKHQHRPLREEIENQRAVYCALVWLKFKLRTAESFKLLQTVLGNQYPKPGGGFMYLILLKYGLLIG